MKKYFQLILSFSFLWMSISCDKSSSNDVHIIRSSKYKKIIRQSYKDLGLQMYSSEIPGLSIAVYLNNEVVWSDGYGFSNKELNVEATPNTKFRIGGVSKLFTGALLAKMVEDGEINLKTPIRTYYPELPNDKDSITLYTLASHTSGLRAVGMDEENNQGLQSLRKGLSVFIEDSLLFKPGQYFYETDYGYDLIGATMERIKNSSFNKILAEKITDTLRLASTTVDHPFLIIKDRSQCYDKNYITQTIRATTTDKRHREASVGLLSSALDIATLVNEYLHPKFFKEETVKMILEQGKLTSGTKTNYGLGLQIGKDNLGNELYSSFGSTKGGSSAVIAYPKYDLVIAIASNQTNDSNSLPIFKIATNFIEMLAPKPKEKTDITKTEK